MVNHAMNADVSCKGSVRIHVTETTSVAKINCEILTFLSPEDSSIYTNKNKHRYCKISYNRINSTTRCLKACAFILKTGRLLPSGLSYHVSGLQSLNRIYLYCIYLIHY